MGKTIRKTDFKTNQQHHNKKEDRKLKEQFKKERKRNKNYNKDYSSSTETEFAKLLHSLNLRCKIMQSDGNCLFHSISDQLGCKIKSYTRIREEVVEFMINNEGEGRCISLYHFIISEKLLRTYI